MALFLPLFGDKFSEWLGGSQAPPSFSKVPGLPRKFPKLPRKFPGDFPSLQFFVPKEHPNVLSFWCFVAGEHPNVPSFRFLFRGNIRQNRPFGKPPFCVPPICFRENQTCTELRSTISRHLLPPISRWGGNSGFIQEIL